MDKQTKGDRGKFRKSAAARPKSVKKLTKLQEQALGKINANPAKKLTKAVRSSRGHQGKLPIRLPVLPRGAAKPRSVAKATQAPLRAKTSTSNLSTVPAITPKAKKSDAVQKTREKKEKKAAQPKERKKDSKGEYYYNGFGQKIYYADKEVWDEKAGKINDAIRGGGLAAVTKAFPEIAVPFLTATTIAKELNEGDTSGLTKFINGFLEKQMKSYFS